MGAPAAAVPGLDEDASLVNEHDSHPTGAERATLSG
jgi:hypothetical protein